MSIGQDVVETDASIHVSVTFISASDPPKIVGAVTTEQHPQLRDPTTLLISDGVCACSLPLARLITCYPSDWSVAGKRRSKQHHLTGHSPILIN